jgi:membrane protein YdbS with pleckstrin-like domain
VIGEAKVFPWEVWIARWLKVPPPPVDPAGSAGSARVFHAAPGYYLYRVFLWALGQLGAGIGVFWGHVFLAAIPDAKFLGIHVVTLIRLMESFAILTYLSQIPLTFAVVHMDFRMRWYIVTDRSLRIREGIYKVREQTMTFSNIQNMTIHQGPLQRLLGIEDLEVSSAGGGGSSPSEQGHQAGIQNMHTAYFRGVDRAAPIRDAIMVHLRKVRGTGLGDPEDHAGPHAATGVAHEETVLDAARELLEEARALRRTLG